MSRPCIFLFSLFLVKVGTCFGADIPEIVRDAKPAIVQLLVSDVSGQIYKTGTGFFVTSKGLLITNYHVVQGGTSIVAVSLTGDYYKAPGSSAHRVKDLDICLVHFPTTNNPHLELKNVETVEGQRVLVIGNPEGLQGTVSDGIVSAIRADGDLIQITAPISHGSSGSPVLNEDGEVIGIATSIFKEGQNLNFAISTKAVITTMEKIVAADAGTKAPLDLKAAREYIAQGDAKCFHTKDYLGAISDYDKALEFDPTNAVAYQQRSIAKLHTDDCDGAIADASRAIELNARLDWSYVLRATARFNKGEFKNSIRDCDQALMLDAKNELAYLLRGDCEFCTEKYDSAISDYDKALILDPKDRRSYFNRGLSEQAKGSLNSALSDFVRSDALAEEPSAHASAHVAIWVIRSLQGKVKEANDELSAYFRNLPLDNSLGWLKTVADFILDTTSEADLIATASSSSGAKRKERLCDAYYYIGVKRLIIGDHVSAAVCFGKCLTTEATYSGSFVLAKSKLATKDW